MASKTAAISKGERRSPGGVCPSRLALTLAMGTAALMGGASPAVAADTTWTGATSTDWFVTGNWDTGAAPTAGDVVHIDTTVPNPAVVNGANAVANNVLLGVTAGGAGALTITNGGTLSGSQGSLAWTEGSTGAVTVTGAGSAWINSDNLHVGLKGIGTLTISSGGAVSDINGYIGLVEGSNGTATVTGAGSTWTNSADMHVGLNGTGTLLVSNGGAVSNIGGYVGVSAGATATVTGAGSTWMNSGGLTLGYIASGTLTVANGGVVTSAFGTMGRDAGSTGKATIDGTGSAWTNTGALVLGQSGSAELTISNGGEVSNDTGTLGDNVGSIGTATVDGVGSTWTNGAELRVGNDGTGALTISNGGTVSSNAGYVGFGQGSNGSVTVTGAGSTWTTGIGLTVGRNGTGALTIADGGTVTSSSGDIGAFIGGTGTVTVDGAGSALTFANNLLVGFSGGNGFLTIQSGGTVTNQNATLGSQPGSTGTVTVTGTGSTWINTGDLFVGVHDTGMMSIANGGTVVSTNGFVGELADAASAAFVDGVGSNWTNSGNLTIGADGTGTLSISNGGAVSNAFGALGEAMGSVGTAIVDGAGSTWSNSADLRVGESGTGTLTIANGGAVSVTGPIVLASQAGSTGTLNIGGAQGAAAAAAGMLSAAALEFGGGTGALNFNHTGSNHQFSTIMLGAGTINQVAGVTKLTGDGSNFLGATNITGGSLYVNNMLGGTVNVNGGTLGGSGTLTGTLAVNAGGTIAPGNSIGTLNVAGNITQAAGSVYQVELTSTGMSDLIHATGTATIADGAELNILKTDAAHYVVGTRYTVLQADGGVTGAYTLTNSGSHSAFLGLVGAYDATHAYLDVAKTKSFASVGLTPNQSAAGAGAESLGAGNALYDAIILSPTDAVAQAAFDQISGEIHASAKTAMIEDSRFLREAAIDRLRVALGEMRNDAAGGNTQPGVWARGFGSYGQWNGDGNAATMTRNTGGLFVGADGVIGDNWRLGVVGGYGHSSYSVGERNSSAESNDYHVGLYGGTEWGDLAFRSGLAYSWHDIDTRRTASFPGFANTLTSDYGAGTTQAFGELGYRFKVEDVILEPFANLAYVNLATGGFSEAGGTGALDVAAGGTNATFTTLGLRASTSFTLDNGAAITARAMIGWRHAFGDTTPTSGMAFPGGSAFTIAGVPMAGDAALIDLGLDLNFTPSATLGLAYGGQFGAASIDQTIKGTLNVQF